MHLRGILIAGVLAAVALALGLVTLGMNQTASQAAPPKTILPLKLRHHAHVVRKTEAATGVKKAKAAPKKKAAPKPDRNYVAALKAGLPRSVAHGLAEHAAVVVQLTSASDAVAELSASEAKAGAAAAGASYVAVNVDRDGGDVEVLTRLLGNLPPTPAALIYMRPATLATTLPGFNDRTVIEQAVANAVPSTVVSGNDSWAAQANAICAAGDVAQTSSENYAAGSAVMRQTIDKLTALKPPQGESAALKAANAELRQAPPLMDQAVAKGAATKAGALLYVKALIHVGKAFVTYNRLGATGCTSTS